MIKKWLKKLDSFVAKIAIYIIYVYQWTISPDKWILSVFFKGKICAHEPHCSEYWVRVLKRYGFFNWIPMILDRVLHCLPSNRKMYDPDHYRVVFFSSAEIGTPFLEELVNDKRFEVVGVVTQEDKPVGRGLKLTPNVIKTKALELWIALDDIYTPNNINPEKSQEGEDFYEWLQQKAPDYCVVIAYWKILPQSILDVPIFGSINVHGSLLPKYRWASPLQSVFLNKDQESWLSIMRMDAWMDSWAIIDKLAFKIPFEWTVKDLIERLMQIGPDFLNDVLWMYAKNEVQAIPQKETAATYCKKIIKQDWEINPMRDEIIDIYSKYRAYAIWPKVWFMHKDKKVVIEKLVLDEVWYMSLQHAPLRDEKYELNPCIKELILKSEWKNWIDFKSFKNWYLK